MLLFAGLLVKTKALASIQRPKARFSNVQMCVRLCVCICILCVYVCIVLKFMLYAECVCVCVVAMHFKLSCCSKFCKFRAALPLSSCPFPYSLSLLFSTIPLRQLCAMLLFPFVVRRFPLSLTFFSLPRWFPWNFKKCVAACQCVHAYKRTHIFSCCHRFMYVHTCMHKYVSSNIYSFMYVCMHVCVCEFELLELISLRATQAKNNINRINKLRHFNISTCAASSVERGRLAREKRCERQHATLRLRRRQAANLF